MSRGPVFPLWECKLLKCRPEVSGQWCHWRDSGGDGRIPPLKTWERFLEQVCDFYVLFFKYQPFKLDSFPWESFLLTLRMCICLQKVQSQELFKKGWGGGGGKRVAKMKPCCSRNYCARCCLWPTEWRSEYTPENRTQQALGKWGKVGRERVHLLSDHQVLSIQSLDIWANASGLAAFIFHCITFNKQVNPDSPSFIHIGELS